MYKKVLLSLLGIVVLSGVPVYYYEKEGERQVEQKAESEAYRNIRHEPGIEKAYLKKKMEVMPIQMRAAITNMLEEKDLLLEANWRFLKEHNLEDACGITDAITLSNYRKIGKELEYVGDSYNRACYLVESVSDIAEAYK